MPVMRVAGQIASCELIHELQISCILMSNKVHIWYICSLGQ